MGSVLLANAWGGGLGHATLLGTVGEALAAGGHRIVFAVPDVFAARPVLARLKTPVLTLPRHAVTGEIARSMCNYADLLASKGFEDPAALASILTPCEDLLEVVQPDLLVVDHAPTMQLAAWGKVETVVIGAAMEVPPGRGHTFPDFASDGRGFHSTDRLLGSMNSWMERKERPPLSAITELFPSHRSFPLVPPELDPYAEYRESAACGEITATLPNLPTPELDITPHVFAYLGARQPGVCDLLQYLATEDFTVECYLRDADNDVQSKLRQAGVQLHVEPADFAEVLARAHLFIHHGSQGSAGAGLAVGRPQLSLPIDREKQMINQCLERLGVTRSLPSGGSFRDAAKHVRELCLDPAMHETAQRCAQQQPRQQERPALAAIVKCCEELLNC